MRSDSWRKSRIEDTKNPPPGLCREGDFYSLHQAFGAKMFLTY
uniref:Uncharacterized protein n=1 Tax=Myoviridae sp. ctEg02 TaxID=2825061 RepID=A0A8S5PRG7_9CAUD|nr:MAG TPA: hypothetical protein [Myoviridae sp. ctEg02]